MCSVGNKVPTHTCSQPYYWIGGKSFSHNREAIKMHKSNSSFCCMSHLMLVESLGLDLCAMRKKCLNVQNQISHVNWVYGETKNVNIFWGMLHIGQSEAEIKEQIHTTTAWNSSSQANRNQQNAMSLFTPSYHINCKVILTLSLQLQKAKGRLLQNLI